MEFLSYGKQWIEDDDIQAVLEVLKSDWLTQGPKVEEFEKAICEYTGAKYCVAFSNGTAALHLSVMALGLKEGFEGITSTNTFVASSNCTLYCGGTPVFADIDKKTYNISSNEIIKKISDKTKLIIPVHFAGQPADMDEIKKIADEKGLYIIEDAAHAIGSKFADGSKVGNCKYSDMTTFSFHPVKAITTGEGGAVTTNNKKFYERLQHLRTHGIIKKNMNCNPGPWYYEMVELGFNYRLTDIQSALGISQLKKLDRFIERRREIVARYNEALKDEEWITIPYEKDKVYSAYHLYVLQIDFDKIGKTRVEVMAELKKNRVLTQVHYIPVHTQPYYQKEFGYCWGDFPYAESYYNKALSLPLYPKLNNNDVDHIIKVILSLK